MQKIVIIALLATAGVYVPSKAHCQVANPVGVEFAPSANHNTMHGTVEPVAVVAGYRMRVFPQAQCPTTTCTGSPAFTLEFNKPAPVTGAPCTVSPCIRVMDIFGGLVLNSAYKGFVEAYGPGGASASAVVGPFGNQPPAPAPTAPPAPPVLLRASSPSQRIQK